MLSPLFYTFYPQLILQLIISKFFAADMKDRWESALQTDTRLKVYDNVDRLLGEIQGESKSK